MNPQTFKIVPNGDAALTILFNQSISESLSRQIIALGKCCKSLYSHQLRDIIPAYQSLTLCYHPERISFDSLVDGLQEILASPLVEDDYQAKIIVVPVCYQEDYAPDLAFVAEHCASTQQNVVDMHSGKEYLVHMLGFSPGFLYLGGLSAKLTCPRKSVPAARVSAGSVGIGGSQTGIYPQASPGGWHIIGRTPLVLFDPKREPPCIAQPLDKIVFEPISIKDFKRLAGTRA